MRIFMTGATGFIGAHVLPELIGAGHHVVALARLDDAETMLTAAGAEALPGSLEDHDSLRAGATDADAVIHLGFNNDFSRFQEVCAIDQAAIEVMGEALAGSGKPLVVPNGMAGLGPDGRVITEDDGIPDGYPFPRASEQATLGLASRGVTACVVRLPQVHDTTKLGLMSRLLQVARGTGVSADPGDGTTRWAAAHVSDVAVLFRLLLERPEAGARYHAVAEEGVAVRDIAKTIGRVLGTPVKPLDDAEAQAHFGPLNMFVGQNMAASAAETRQKLCWHPTGTGALADLEQAAGRET